MIRLARLGDTASYKSTSRLSQPNSAFESGRADQQRAFGLPSRRRAAQRGR